MPEMNQPPVGWRRDPIQINDEAETDEARGALAAIHFVFPRAGGIEVAIAHVEAAMIEAALNACDGVKRRAAERLGISRYALERRLERIRGTLQAQATAQEIAARREAAT